MASAALRPQAARSWLAIAVLALLSLLIAGCVPRRERPRPIPVEPVSQPVEEVRVPRLPPDETRNRVAVLVPLTGPNAALGQSLLNAANLALQDMGGDDFRITAYDTAAGAGPAAEEAIDEGSGLILGPLLADDVRVVAAIARQADVPVIAFSNDESVAGDGVYLMGITPRQSVSRVVSYARGRGLNRFAALVPANVYGRRAGEAMTQAVEGAGGQLTGIQSFERGQGAAAAGRLGAGYEAVLIADGPRVALQIAPVVRRASPQPRLMATELWATETNIGASVGLRGAWYAAPSDALFGQFSTRYRARYNVRPFRLASLGYDSVLLAVRVAANWPVGRAFPEGALRDPGGFSGVDGAFRFDGNGLADRALEVREVGAAGNTTVSPAPRGFN